MRKLNLKCNLTDSVMLNKSQIAQQMVKDGVKKRKKHCLGSFELPCSHFS